MNQITDTASFALLAGEAGFDPIEERLRTNVRATIEAVFEEELASFLGRFRYDRGDGPAKGYRHGHRERQLTGTFGTETVRVPRARIEDDAGKVTEWRSKALPRYQRLTKMATALSGNMDKITDYDVAQDSVRLENAVFTGLSEWGLSASAFAANASGNAADASDRIIYETDTGRLFFDADGNGAAAKVQFATIGANLAVTSADFFVF